MERSEVFKYGRDANLRVACASFCPSRKFAVRYLMMGCTKTFEKKTQPVICEEDGGTNFRKNTFFPRKWATLFRDPVFSQHPSALLPSSIKQNYMVLRLNASKHQFLFYPSDGLMHDFLTLSQTDDVCFAVGAFTANSRHKIILKTIQDPSKSWKNRYTHIVDETASTNK